MKKDILNVLQDWGADPSEALRCRMLGDIDLYEKLLGNFRTSEDMDRLREALGKKDYEKAYYLAHRIKGASGTLSLDPLFRSASALLDDLKQSDYSALEEDFSQLERVYESFCSLLP